LNYASFLIPVPDTPKARITAQNAAHLKLKKHPQKGSKMSRKFGDFDDFWLFLFFF